MNARERLRVMIRTTRGSMTVWSPNEARDALDAYRDQVRAEVLAELAAGDLTVYRASHDSIVMGLYRTAAEARRHCETEERRTWATGTSLTFRWTPDDKDDPDSPEELSIVDDADAADDFHTSYVVTPLPVPAKYDEEADE
ncbi:hypothetical protein [Streptomyces sp. NPDC059076]|uniref:hypothetical protein n=1 Tax=unclassified Streptomyces TaxID=2593676 RepID=UPI00367F6A7A